MDAFIQPLSTGRMRGFQGRTNVRWLEREAGRPEKFAPFGVKQFHPRTCCVQERKRGFSLLFGWDHKKSVGLAVTPRRKQFRCNGNISGGITQRGSTRRNCHVSAEKQVRAPDFCFFVGMAMPPEQLADFQAPVMNSAGLRRET